MKKRYRWLIAVAIALVILIVAGSVYAAHFANSVATTQSHTAAGAALPCPTPILATGLQSYQIVPAQTTASYSVYENLIIQNKPNNDAVGTTHSVQGNFSIKTGANPQVAGMSITVDLSTLQTDSGMRDHFVRQNALQTDTYPDATFVSTCAQGLPTSYSDGQALQFQLVGNLNMHGKTNRETFAVQGKVSGQSITGTATSAIYMTDFGIQPPNLANIAVAQNKVAISITFTAQAK